MSLLQESIQRVKDVTEKLFFKKVPHRSQISETLERIIQDPEAKKKLFKIMIGEMGEDEPIEVGGEIFFIQKIKIKSKCKGSQTER